MHCDPSCAGTTADCCFTSWGHLQGHLHSILTFCPISQSSLCSCAQATALGSRMFSGVLCFCLLSIAFPPALLRLLRPNSHLSEVLPCLSTFLPFTGGSGPSTLCGPSGGHVCSCTQLSCSAVSSLMTKSSSSGSFSVWDSLSFQWVGGANPFPEDFADR